jgi:hypothetical protein
MYWHLTPVELKNKGIQRGKLRSGHREQTGKEIFTIASRWLEIWGIREYEEVA